MRNINRLAAGAEIIRTFSGPSDEDAAMLYHAIMQKKYAEEETEMKAKKGFVLRNITGIMCLCPQMKTSRNLTGSF